MYTIRSDGKRQELKTWDDARAALATDRASSIPAEEIAHIAAVARHRSELAHEKLYGDERFREILDEVTIEGPQAVPSMSYAEAVVGFAQAANALADQVGVPRTKLDKDAEALATGPRLRHVIEKWKRHKVEEKGRPTPHHRAVERLWNEFVKQVGNVFAPELSPAHFRRFHFRAAHEGKKCSSSQWQYDRVSRVRSVIKSVRKKYPEWP